MVRLRWLVCCLMLPLSASAASVLLVPVDDKARQLADELVDPFFTNNKLTVKMAGPGSPAVNCLKDAQRDACLGNIGEKAKVVAVFVVTGAMKGGKATLGLEMLNKGVVVKKESTKVTKGKLKQQMKGPIASLLKLLPATDTGTPAEAPKATVTETPKDENPYDEPAREPDPPKVADAPKKVEPVTLVPAQPVDQLEIKSPPPKPVKPPKVGAWVMTGLAIAAAGTAATFGGLGLANKGRLETVNEGVSTLSYNEAVALQNTSNTQLTVALGTGIGAGVAGVVAGILWGVD